MKKRILGIITALSLLSASICSPIHIFAANETETSEEIDAVDIENTDGYGGLINDEESADQEIIPADAASGSCGTNLYWSIEDTVLTISGSGKMSDYSSSKKAPWYDYAASLTDLVIEEDITYIGNYAFKDCENIREADIPDSVTSLGKYAFFGCSSLNSIQLSDNLTSIGESVFYSCKSLREIYIPNSVTSLGEDAFWNCSSLNSVYLSSNLTGIYDYTFCGCSSITELNIPDSVTYIGSSAFSGCSSLKSVNIPAGIDKINACVFEDCEALTNLDIPDSVTSINLSAFINTGLSEISISDSVTSIQYGGGGLLPPISVAAGNTSYLSENGVLYDKNKTDIIAYPSASSAADFDIPETVTNISSNAFNYSANLTAITIPENVQMIGSYAFSYCKALSELTIENGLVTVGSYAFYNCSSLESVTLPESVNRIANYAFRSCTSLKEAVVLNPEASFGDNVFKSDNSVVLRGYVDSTAQTYAEENDISFEPLSSTDTAVVTYDYSTNGGNYAGKESMTVGIGKEADLTITAIKPGCTFLGWNTDPNAYEALSSYIVNGDTTLYAIFSEYPSFITLPATASGICGDSAYWMIDSTGILYVYGSGEVGGYDDKPWYDYRKSINKLIVEEGITSIGKSAFSLGYFKTMQLPESLESIDESAFSNSDLTEAEIPAGVNTISGNLFRRCDNLTAVTVNPDNAYFTAVDGVLFTKDMSTLISYPSGKTDSSYIIPNGVKEIGKYSFYYNSALTDITFSSTVESIGNYAFEYCEKITNADFNDGLLEIGYDSFARCYALTSLYLPNTLTLIDGYAFSYCSALNEINLPDNLEKIENGAFNSTAVKTINIPSGLKSIGSYVFSGCTDLTEITVDSANMYFSAQDGVLFDLDKTILYSYPAGKTTKSYSIPAGVLTVNAGAFDGCTYLTSVTIPYKTNYIGYGAFEDCSSLKEVTIKDKYVTIKATTYSIPFEGSSSSLVIKGYSGSTAEECAESYGYNFTAIAEADYCKVTYNYLKTGGQSATKTIDYVESGSKADLTPTAERSGRVFLGWNTDYTAEKALSSLTVAENVTLYAIWKSIGTADTPVITAEDIENGKQITISCALSGASIYYTTDSTTPTTDSELYTSAIKFTTKGTRTVKAIAVKEDYKTSKTASKSVTVKKASSPSASVASGTISKSTNVTLTSSTSGAVIYYTTDGTAPNSSSKKYTGSITVDQSMTIKAIASAYGYADSDTASFTYTYSEKQVSVPSVETNDADNISQNSAQLSGTVTDDGGDTPSSYKIVYWDKYNSGAKYTVTTGSAFKASVTNLSAGTEYYYYAQASNDAGTGTGYTKSFTTIGDDTPSSISVSPTYVSLSENESIQLLTDILPANADTSVVWSTSDKKVATVSTSGKVTAVSEGTATITVTTAQNRLNASCTVRVAEDEDVAGSFDFSEWNMASNTSSWADDGFSKNTCVNGANSTIATAYLARWDGAVLEEDDEYPTTDDNSNPQSFYNEVDSVYHVQEVLWIPKRSSSDDNNEIKAALMNYGALYASYQNDWDYWDSSYCKNYYYPESVSTSTSGHAVAIVGWDDNYSASNFKITPPGNGAFICKNSWGTTSGYNGFFYISYYDKYMAKTATCAAVTSLESGTNYNKIYQYDPLGAVSAKGAENTIYAANVFPQKGSKLINDEILRAVSFYTYYKDTTYSVYIVTDYEDSSSLKSLGTACASGTISDMGYHTVSLDNAITLKAGTRFAVVIKLDVPGKKSYIYYEYPKKNYSENAKANSDESYISSDGTSWDDLTGLVSNANCCIKAFTDNGTSGYSLQLFSGINNSEREYESSFAYTLDEALAAGIEINEDYIKWEREKENNKDLLQPASADDYALGEEPSIIETGDNSVSYSEGSILPSKYDLREEGYVSSVKYQNPWGTCWAHAMYASLESCMLRKGATAVSGFAELSDASEYLTSINQDGSAATNIVLDKSEAVMMPGVTMVLSAQIYPANSDETSVIWSSSNEDVAMVDTNGFVTAISDGDAVITAETADGSSSAQCQITVSSSAEVSSIEFEYSSVTKNVGDVFILDCSADVYVPNDMMTWESSDDSVVSVGEYGVLTANSIGKSIITVSYGDVSASIVVNVNDGMDVEITAAAVKMNAAGDDDDNSSYTVNIVIDVNNRLDNELSATAYTAIYDGSGVLAAVQSQDVLIDPGNTRITFTGMELNDVEPENYTAKAMIWNKDGSPLAVSVDMLLR